MTLGRVLSDWFSAGSFLTSPCGSVVSVCLFLRQLDLKSFSDIITVLIKMQ